MTQRASLDASATSRTHVPDVCFAVFVVAWVALAFAPLDRTTWMLENLLTVVAVTSAVLTFGRFRFRDRAYVGATIFLLIHTLGSHYTYSCTPLGELARAALGGSRNHYDRFAHFAFGALLVPAIRDLAFRPPAKAPFVRQLVITIAIVAGLGSAYEVLEWLTAIVVDPASGTAYLGTQGDEWDAQKDLLAAGAGGVVGALIEARALMRGGRRQPSRRPG